MYAVKSCKGDQWIKGILFIERTVHVEHPGKLFGLTDDEAVAFLEKQEGIEIKNLEEKQTKKRAK